MKLKLNKLRNSAIDYTVSQLIRVKAKPKPLIFEEIKTLLNDPNVCPNTKLKVLVKVEQLIKEASNA